MLIINNGSDFYIVFMLPRSCQIYFLLLCPLRRLLNNLCRLWTLRNMDQAILFISFVTNCTIILVYDSGTFNTAAVSRRITENLQLNSNTKKKIYLWYRRIWSLIGFPDNRCLRSSISGSTLLIWTSKYMLRYTIYTQNTITFFNWVRRNFYGKDGIYDYTN